MAIAQVKENKEEKGVLKYGIRYSDDVISSDTSSFVGAPKIFFCKDEYMQFRCRPCYRYNDNCFVLANYYYEVIIDYDKDNRVSISATYDKIGSYRGNTYISDINDTCLKSIKLFEHYVASGAKKYKVGIMCPDASMDCRSFNLTEYSFLLFKDEDLISAKSLRKNPKIDNSKVDFLCVNAYRNFDFIIQGDKYKDVIKQNNEFREVSCSIENAVGEEYNKSWGNLITIEGLDFRELTHDDLFI